MSAILPSPVTFRRLIRSCVGMENPYHFGGFTIEISGTELNVLPTIASFSGGSLQSSSILLGAFLLPIRIMRARWKRWLGPQHSAGSFSPEPPIFIPASHLQLLLSLVTRNNCGLQVLMPPQNIPLFISWRQHEAFVCAWVDLSKSPPCFCHLNQDHHLWYLEPPISASLQDPKKQLSCFSLLSSAIGSLFSPKPPSFYLFQSCINISYAWLFFPSIPFNLVNLWISNLLSFSLVSQKSRLHLIFFFLTQQTGEHNSVSHSGTLAERFSK